MRWPRVSVCGSFGSYPSHLDCRLARLFAVRILFSAHCRSRRNRAAGDHVEFQSGVEKSFWADCFSNRCRNHLRPIEHVVLCARDLFLSDHDGIGVRAVSRYFPGSGRGLIDRQLASQLAFLGFCFSSGFRGRSNRFQSVRIISLAGDFIKKSTWISGARFAPLVA